MAIVDVDFPGNIASVATAADLRALPSAQFNESSFYNVRALGFFTWSPVSVAVDDGFTVLRPNDRTPLQPGRWLFGAMGATGKSNNTRASLAELKAALISDGTSLYDNSLWTWSLGDYSTRVDDVNIVKANSTPLTTGAWVRSLNRTAYLPTPYATNYRLLVDGAFSFYDKDRISPATLAGWGTGMANVPRGKFAMTGRPTYVSVLGGGIRGHSDPASALEWNASTAPDVGLKFQTYINLTIEDLRIVNLNSAGIVPNSVGIELNPVGGGGGFQLRRTTIENFDVGVLVGGEGNGDKTLIEGVNLYCRIGWSNGTNTQAIGHTLLNVNGGGDYMLRYGGAGQVVVKNATYNPEKAVLVIPEGGGGEVAGNVVIEDSSFEYHGVQERRMLDAASAVLNGDAGGARALVVLRNVRYDGGPNIPTPTSRATIKVGNGTSGSDGIVVQADGGSWDGNVEIASAIDAPLQRRWHFRDMKKCPNPATVAFQGVGSHPLLEWRGNDNIPDQYRGGQAFNGSFDLLKGWLFRSVGKSIINTGVGDQQTDFAGRKGKNFIVAGLPAGTAMAGLRVYLTKPSNFALQVQQYTGPDFATTIGPLVTVPSGSPKGSYRVHQMEPNLADGVVYVRMTLPATNQAVEGALIVEYMAYMGV